MGGEAQAIEVAETSPRRRNCGAVEDQAGNLSVCTSKGLIGRIAEDRFIEHTERLPGDCTVVLQDGADAFWIGLSRKNVGPVLL